MRHTNPAGTEGEQSLHNKSELGRPAGFGTADLEVSLLFELFKRDLDTGLPINITANADGRISMTGTVSDAQQLTAIRGIVATLPGADPIDFHIRSVTEAGSTVHRGNATVQELAGSVGDAPAAGLVRDAMIARGLQGEALKAAEQEFAVSALSHAQAALQNAYALDRLAAILQHAAPASLAANTRVQWVQMVDSYLSSCSLERSELIADATGPNFRGDE